MAPIQSDGNGGYRIPKRAHLWTILTILAACFTALGWNGESVIDFLSGPERIRRDAELRNEVVHLRTEFDESRALQDKRFDQILVELQEIRSVLMTKPDGS